MTILKLTNFKKKKVLVLATGLIFAFFLIFQKQETECAVLSIVKICSKIIPKMRLYFYVQNINIIHKRRQKIIIKS